MAKPHILVVDDEPDILSILKYNLEKNEYTTTCVKSGESALKVAREQQPDLILLDLMLPGINGLDVCRIIRQDPAIVHIPIIMLTAKGTEADIVTGLELGADDYVTKPFSPKELVARVGSVLRRQRVVTEHDSPVLSKHGIQINSDRREVRVNDTAIDLTATEFDILYFLIKRPGWVRTRDQIIENVRGDNYPVTDRTVDVHITSLRKKLGGAGENLETVRGVGYRFRE